MIDIDVQKILCRMRGILYSENREVLVIEQGDKLIVRLTVHYNWERYNSEFALTHHDTHRDMITYIDIACNNIKELMFPSD